MSVETIEIEEFMKSVPDFVKKDLDKLLSEAMPRGRENLYFRQKPTKISEPVVDGKTHILFLSYYPHPTLVKKSIILRKSGKYYTTFIGCCIREDNTPYEFFDEVYEVEDYKECIELMSTCMASVVHALIHHWIFGFIAHYAKRKNGSRMVIEINDSMLFVQKSSATLECRAEAWLLRNADVFVHRMPGEAVQEMRDEWGLKVPDFQMQCLPLGELFCSSESERNNGPLRIVFAGGVMPPEIAVERGHEGHLFNPVIRSICEANCKLVFFVNQNARNMYWEEHELYFDLQKIYENFSYKTGVPFNILPDTIKNYDVALYYENSPASSYNPKHFKYNMATKIFSYIEAGLPLMVPWSSEMIANMCKQHGIGIMYDIKDIENSFKNIDRGELDRCRKNIDLFRNRYEISKMLPTLAEIYNI